MTGLCGLTQCVAFVSGNDIFVFEVLTGPPALTYRFLQQSTLSDPANPFSPASLNSPVPQNIHALLVFDSYVAAFSGDDMYDYSRGNKVWTNRGLAVCYSN